MTSIGFIGKGVGVSEWIPMRASIQRGGIVKRNIELITKSMDMEAMH